MGKPSRAPRTDAVVWNTPVRGDARDLSERAEKLLNLCVGLEKENESLRFENAHLLGRVMSLDRPLGPSELTQIKKDIERLGVGLFGSKWTDGTK